MFPIVWLESADADLADITDYIGLRDIAAAERLWYRIRNSVLPLSQHPYLYRSSERVPGLRELVAHPNYLVLYRVGKTCIEVVNVVHARREFPAPTNLDCNRGPAAGADRA
ncbi:MAG: type II toxin-antitoxin system RelE/ParE family toxin [Serpentinimonas sp.]|nr:MAG: plasmid stabilization protein ParE [Comamonadaceae bacterium BICA1-1]MDO8275924.1 type II toxin-antitoxin system RelE/ParE family toxin [Serpentinimonas sp.]MDO9612242.1 type II toxin-antitoxin system RelE/ParE family toxin [Serpentinimonas sp.]